MDELRSEIDNLSDDAQMQELNRPTEVRASWVL